MKVSRSGYYKWLNNKDILNNYEINRKNLGELIIDIHRRKPSYGYHRINKIIRDETGWYVSSNLVHKVCKILNIKSKAKHYKYKRPGEESIKYSNIINGNWKTSRPFEKVVSDTTTFYFKKRKYDWTFYLDVFNNEIVGYLFGYIINDYINLKPVAKLDALFVKNAYRNMKIATKLIEEFKKWCQENNATYINVSVWSDNIVAKHLYMKQGFIPKKEELFLGYKPKKYQKLVRDKIPEIIKQNKEEPVTRILSDNEYKEELEKKLYEEYIEVLNSNNTDRIEELADMLEVMISLAKLENKSLEDIIDVAKKKKEKRGGFEQKIYLEAVK